MFFAYLLIVWLVLLLEEALGEIREEWGAVHFWRPIYWDGSADRCWHLVSSATTFNRNSQYQSWTRRRAEAGIRPRCFPAAFIPCTVSPYSPEIVGLLAIGGFLMSPFKMMFNYFFLHVLQGSVLTEYFFKINLQLNEKNNPNNPNILKQKLSHQAERTAGKSGLWAEVEMLLHSECSALSRLNSQNVHQHSDCQTKWILCALVFLCVFLSSPSFDGEGRCLCVCVCISPYIHMLDYHWHTTTKG